MSNKYYALGFSAFSGIGTIRFEKLVTHFGSSENAWNGSKSELIDVLGQSLGQKFCEFRKTFDLQKYVQDLQKKSIEFLTPDDQAYPKLLRQLSHPPFILFVKGNIDILGSEKILAIVGTRKVTGYGMQVTEMLTRDLVRNGFTIVSGMALGVDGIAHREAVKNNGKTIAVLGSGVDVPTPREHENLYHHILEKNGAIVSTFSPGEMPGKGSFPARNAIIAGLSRGVVVTEGAEDSGALITAEYGKKFGRPVFSVPGQITSQLSKGTNNLLKSGAIPVTNSGEILDTLGIMETQKAQIDHTSRTVIGSTEEKEILRILENGPLLFDEIVRTIGKDSKKIGSLLSLMELKAMIRSDKEGKYSI